MVDNMADDSNETNKSSILYELVVLSEWVEDYDSVISKTTLNNSLQESTSYFNLWKLLWKSQLNNLSFLQTEYSWHLSASKDGKVVAVLQDTLLEIRTAKDEYSSVVGKACLSNDQYPKLRKLSWSPDNSFLALARDNGVVHVFNLFGSNVATIEPSENSNGVLQPVVGLCFLQLKFENTKWSNELLIIYHKGNVKSILLSHLDGYESEENIKFSLESYYPQGISAVAYDSRHLLAVAGPSGNNEHGIIVWRFLNDYPFLKTAFDSEKGTRNSRSFFRILPGFLNQSNPKTISKMKISPDGNMLACLHLSGEISLWRMPGIQLYRKWSLKEQPQFDKSNPQISENDRKELSFYPVDICWWSSLALVIARKNGAISVCSISNLDNLLGDSPEFLASSPQVSSIEGDRSGVIALECEMAFNEKKRPETEETYSDKDYETSELQASIQAAIYSFTDIERFEPKRKKAKVSQKTYRMVALKPTTPEELYTRKIDCEEYEEALTLAQKYNLDCDLVYQKRWRNSKASKESIHEFLDKVTKIMWVVNECVERVPEELEDAKKLLEFGLNKTEIKIHSIDKLNVNEKKLVSYRRQLLKYSDKLTIYEKIIGSPSKYNSADYDNFRKKSPIGATVNFAREENWRAVSIMFTYAGKEVLPHWLPVLSNFPETLKPVHYRSLLPEVVFEKVTSWEVRKLRELDWSEQNAFQSLSSDESNNGDEILYKKDVYLREFRANPLTVEMVEEWYKTRTYEIEKKTGVVDYAFDLVVLARQRGVKVGVLTSPKGEDDNPKHNNLNQLHNDLITLQSLVYEVGDENVTLSKLEALSHMEQCKLLLTKTTKNSFIYNLKHLIVPFTKRCNEQRCHNSYSLLKDILLGLSEKSLELPLQLLSYLKEGFMNPLNLTLSETVSIVLDCIYSCPKDDQLETAYLILECLPQRDRWSKIDDKLHERIDRLEVHLELCEILGCYQTPKSIRFVHENENNEDIGKQLMKNMAEYTKRETLDFTQLLSDLEFIRSKLFISVPKIFCYELCALSQMSCECEEIIQSAEDIMECKRGEKNKMIPFERTVELVLQAARNHFEKAINYDDHCLLLSQTCLRIIGEPHPHVYEELDLIESVQLLGDFDVNVLPLQVRKCDNRMKLIESCLKAKPKNYRACQRLLQLAQNLRIYGEDRVKREGEVLILIAECALNYSDYQYCSEICHGLVRKNFSPSWAVVQLLGQKKEYKDKIDKKLFLAFAILHCPVENLEELIESRIELHQKYFEEAAT